MNEYQMLLGIRFSSVSVFEEVRNCLMSYGHSRDSANQWIMNRALFRYADIELIQYEVREWPNV